MKRHSRFPLAAALLSFLASLPLAAQTVEPSAPAGAPKEEPIVLSPFVVNAADDNNGYRTNSTVSGAKIATPLENLPLTIDVINREFINDAHLVSVADAARYVAGVGQYFKNEYDTESFSIRGFNTIALLRNGINFHAVTDTVNVERVEVVKGPAAVLYGVVEPGGLVNYTTKQPTSSAFSSAKVTIGSYNYHRLELDVNQPLNEKKTIAFRMPAAITEADSFQKYVGTKAIFLNPTLTINFSPRTSLTFDYTYRLDRGTWNRGGFFVFNTNDPISGAYIHRPQVTPPQFDDLIGRYNYGQVGPDDYSRREHIYAEIRFNHSFSDNLSFQAAFSEERARMHDTGGFMGLITVPGLERKPVNQLVAADMLVTSLNWLETVRIRQKHYEATFVYKSDWGSVKNNLVTGLSASVAPVNYAAFTWSGGAAPNVPLTAPDSVRFARGNRAAYVPWFTFTDPVVSSNPPDWGSPSLFVADQLAAFDEKLHVLLGYRLQRYNDVGESKGIPQIGAIYALTKSISAYATYSESMRSNGFVSNTVSSTSTPRPMEKAHGFDVGLKMSFRDGMIEGSVAYFKIQKTNVAFTDLTNFIDSNGNILGGDSVLIAGQADSDGFEASFQVKPFKNTQLSLSYAHLNAVDTKDGALNQGARLPGAIKDSFTFLGKYRFTTGALTGFEIGGGGVITLGNVRYFLPSSNYSDIYQRGGYTDLTAFARYNTRVFGKAVTFGLTVNNLTDERYINATFNVAPPRQIFGSVEVWF
ncbi:TonB-dependent siderophore receptor [Oleiharenicola lentus]|uniref:TonB-dependent siderophore receptor n=1 Tax=Oleiharenicola lentus TaxID=2508720 RepID=UPI003F6659DB